MKTNFFMLHKVTDCIQVTDTDNRHLGSIDSSGVFNLAARVKSLHPSQLADILNVCLNVTKYMKELTPKN